MKKQSNPQINFPDITVAYCARHLEPFRKDFPKGYGMLCVKLMEYILADERFVNLLPLDGATQLRRLEYASQTLVEISPLCCFMGDNVMSMLTAMCLGKVQ